eukprot:c20487_g1_i1.p1 GENE.c20487_g1_i1~~c20487_g1_i1.p1  ORF type:complete len:954 (-),score=197.01 c20487_g1_i1:124-2880(-)
MTPIPQFIRPNPTAPNHEPLAMDALTLDLIRTSKTLSGSFRRAYYKELVFFVAFIAFFLACVRDILPVRVLFLQNRALKQFFFDQEFPSNFTHVEKDFFNIRKTSDVFDWIEGPFLENILTSGSGKRLRNICTSIPDATNESASIFEFPLCECSLSGICRKSIRRSSGSITSPDCIFSEKDILRHNRLVGPIRVRQLRLSSAACRVSANSQRIGGQEMSCRSTKFSRESFGPDCTSNATPRNSRILELNSRLSLNTSRCFDYTSKVGWEVFRPENDVGYGTFGWYQDSGGFMLDIYPEFDIAQKQVGSIRNDFFDRHTMVLEITLNLYNADSNVVTVVETVFLFHDSGFIDADYRTTSIPLRPYLENQTFKIVIQCIYVLFMFYYTKEEILEFRDARWSYFLEFWNYVEWTSLLLAFALVGAWVRLQQELLKLEFDPTETCDYQPTVDLTRLVRNTYSLLGTTMFFTFLKINKFLKFNSRLHVLWRVLMNAAKDLIAFVIIFVLIMIGFVMWAYFSFGPYVAEFHTFGASLSSLFRLMLGDSVYSNMAAQSPFLAPFFFTVYRVVVVYIVLNVFIAIINEWYADSKLAKLREKQLKAKGLSGVDYDIFGQVKEWLFMARAYRLGVTVNNAPVHLETGKTCVLHFDTPYLETTATNISVLDSSLLEEVVQGSFIVANQGVIFRVDLPDRKEGVANCTVVATGHIQSFESIWVQGKLSTYPGLPTLCIRVGSYFQKWINRLNCRKPPSTGSGVRTVTTKSEFEREIYIPEPWSGETYQCHHGLRFHVNQLYRLLTRITRKQVEAGMFQSVTFLFLHDELVTSLAQLGTVNAKDILNFLMPWRQQVAMPRLSNTEIERRNSINAPEKKTITVIFKGKVWLDHLDMRQREGGDEEWAEISKKKGDPNSPTTTHAHIFAHGSH